MGRNMSFDFGLGESNACIKRKFRWLFKIPDISADGIQALPPTKAARPQLTFKEMDVQHLSEQVFYPSKPEWKPLQLSLFDLKKNQHPVWGWIKRIYDAQAGTFKPVVGTNFKLNATLELYDGCGNTIESWTLENVWPQDINFGDLDMGSSEYLTCDLTLRYDRAYMNQ